MAHTMDPSGPFWGARPAKKYVHTRRYTLEKIAKKSRFLDTAVHGALSSPIEFLRSKMVLNMFFGPETILYDAWMMFPIDLEKLFALENWSQSDFFTVEPVGFLLLQNSSL